MERFSFLDFGIRLFKFQRKRETKRKNHHHPFRGCFLLFGVEKGVSFYKMMLYLYNALRCFRLSEAAPFLGSGV